MDEQQLLKLIMDGDELAFEKLLKIYNRMIYKIIYSFRLDYGDYNISTEDLYQEACVALNDAVYGYDENRGAAFSTFAFLLIKRTLCRRVKEIKQTYINEGFSIERQMEENGYDPSTVNVPLLYHEEVELQARIKAFMNTLSEEDLKIIELRRNDASYQEIAINLGISAKRVDNRLYSIKKGIRQYLDN